MTRRAPLFSSLSSGLGCLVERLAATLQSDGAHVHTGAAVTALERDDGRWRLAVSGNGAIRSWAEADAVVLAIPAFGAADLLDRHDSRLAGRLRSIGYASVNLVTLAYPQAAVGHPLDGAGFLVPRNEGWLITACTWMTSKWPHLRRPGEVLLRVSTGRWGDERSAGLADDELVGAVHAELVAPLGLSAPPSWSRVWRWPAAFPQYEPGHLDQVARIEAAAKQLPLLTLTGAAYRGIGIPACIAQGQQAAATILAGIEAVATR